MPTRLRSTSCLRSAPVPRPRRRGRATTPDRSPASRPWTSSAPPRSRWNRSVPSDPPRRSSARRASSRASSSSCSPASSSCWASSRPAGSSASIRLHCSRARPAAPRPRRDPPRSGRRAPRPSAPSSSTSSAAPVPRRARDGDRPAGRRQRERRPRQERRGRRPLDVLALRPLRHADLRRPQEGRRPRARPRPVLDRDHGHRDGPGDDGAVQLRAADSAGLDGSERHRHRPDLRRSSEVVLRPSSPASTRYLVLWFTRVPDTDQGRRIVVDEVVVR